MFRSAMTQYVENLEALRDFVSVVTGYLSGELGKQMKSDADALSPLLVILARLKADEPATDRLTAVVKNIEGKVTVTPLQPDQAKEVEFFRLLSVLLKTEKMSRDELFSWPLFREIRQCTVLNDGLASSTRRILSPSIRQEGWALVSDGRPRYAL